MLITINNDLSVLGKDTLMTELRNRLDDEWADALDDWLGEVLDDWIDSVSNIAFTCLPGAGMTTEDFRREANWRWEEVTRDGLSYTIGSGPSSVVLVAEGKTQHWHALARVS